MPRYLVALLIFAAGLSQASEASIPESKDSSIGYPSVQEALVALRADTSISESEQGGWLIFADAAHHTLWSFTPSAHPAHPSAVRREAIERDGAVYMQMSVLCQADKAACDQLVRDFQRLNEQMSQAIKSRSGGHAH